MPWVPQISCPFVPSIIESVEVSGYNQVCISFFSPSSHFPCFGTLCEVCTRLGLGCLPGELVLSLLLHNNNVPFDLGTFSFL